MRKLCINARFGFPISMDDRFRLIKAAGFDGIILGWGKENPELEGDRKKHPELAGKYGLFVENIHLPNEGVNCQYGSRLAVLHLHDNDGTKDQHLLLGEGKLDWKSITRKLKASGYSGPITLEVSNNSHQNAGIETPESFLKNAYEAV